jgi:thymidylate kinase
VWRTVLLIDALAQVLVMVSIPLRLGTVVVSDRYVFDQMVDLALDIRPSQHEFREWTRKPYYRLFPRPDEIFLLDVDMMKAYSRKPDARPISDWMSRQRWYFVLSTAIPMTVVNASRDFESVHSDIRARVLSGLGVSGLKGK